MSWQDDPEVAASAPVGGKWMKDPEIGDAQKMSMTQRLWEGFKKPAELINKAAEYAPLALRESTNEPPTLATALGMPTGPAQGFAAFPQQILKQANIQNLAAVPMLTATIGSSVAMPLLRAALGAYFAKQGAEQLGTAAGNISVQGLPSLPAEPGQLESIVAAPILKRIAPSLAPKPPEFGGTTEQWRNLGDLLTGVAGLAGATSVGPKAPDLSGLKPADVSSVRTIADLPYTKEGPAHPVMPPIDTTTPNRQIGLGTTRFVAPEQGPAQRVFSGVPVTPEDLRPAIQLAGRLLIGQRGDTHADVLARNGIDPDTIPHVDKRRGFASVKDPDTFLNRRQAEKVMGKPGTAEAGGLDSMDLPDAAQHKLLRESEAPNAIPELRADRIPEAQPSGNIQKVEEEIRGGTGAARDAQKQEGLQAQRQAPQGRGIDDRQESYFSGVPIEPFREREREFRGPFALMGPRLAMTPKEIGFSDTGKQVDAVQLRNRLKNKLTPTEWGIYESQGIGEFLKEGEKKSPEEVAKWMQEKGPRVEVRKSTVGRDNELFQKMNEAQHKLETLGYEIETGYEAEDVFLRRRGAASRDVIDPESEEWKNTPKEVKDLIQQYAEARDLRSFNTESDIQGTHWKMISPKPESEMEGYVEGAVTVPTKFVKSYQDFLNKNNLKDSDQAQRQFNISNESMFHKGPLIEDDLFPSSHSFPPNTLGFFRGYMEPRADGGKTFLVIEGQSDWAQRVRDQAESQRQRLEAGGPRAALARFREREVGLQEGHPLLKDYERLIAKASIDHALKEGANRIAIVDAETAMMTEGHDQTGRIEDYEPGMRLHYDRTFPKVYEELTGEEGKRVEFGENKMAFDRDRTNDEYRRGVPELQPRKNLIFRNPDGTPKTSISAREFDLSRIAKEVSDKPLSLIGKDRPESRETLAFSGVPIPEELAKLAKDTFDKALIGIYNKSAASRYLDASDNIARREGHMFGNRIRVALPNKTDDMAVTFIREAGGDPAKLRQFSAQIGEKNPKAQEAINRALMDLNRLKPHADALKTKLDQTYKLLESKGIDPGYVEDYMRHSFEDVNRGTAGMGPGGGQVSTSILKPRTYPNYATAIAEGEKPRSLMSSDLAESYISMANKLVQRKEWIDKLQDFKTAKGESFLTDMVKRGKRWTTPSEYIEMEVMPGLRMAVHRDYKDLMGALLKPSWIREFPAGRALLELEGGLKHFMLAFDSYHMFRVMEREASITSKVGYKRGLSVLDYDKPTIQRMVKNGEITPEMAQKIEAVRPDVDILMQEGLNSMRVSENMYPDLLKKVMPVAGVDINFPARVNGWIFEKLTRGAMVESALFELNRISKTRPELTRQQAAAEAVKQVNVMFGNLGRQGVLKSATARDLANIVALAPGWVESMAQTEARAYKQAGQIPVDIAQGKGLRVGSAARSVARWAVAAYVLNQAINMATRGKPTWENEEPDRKMDAWVPGGPNGFWISPFSSSAEFTHDYLRYGRQSKEEGVLGKGLEATGRIVSNKLSPPMRAEETFRTGRDYSGRKLDASERIDETIKSLAPTPLPLAGITSEVPGQEARQAYSSIGLKVEPASKRETMGGKTFEERRAMVEQEKSERKKDYSSTARATEAAIYQQQERSKQVLNSLSRAQRNWLDSKNIIIPGFDTSIRSGKTSVPMTDEEVKGYVSNMKKETAKLITELQGDTGFQQEPVARQQEIFNKRIRQIAKQLRNDVVDNMGRDAQKMNMTKKYKLLQGQ